MLGVYLYISISIIYSINKKNIYIYNFHKLIHLQMDEQLYVPKNYYCK